MIARIATAAAALLVTSTLAMADMPAATQGETALPPAPPEKIEGRPVQAARSGDAVVPPLGIIEAQSSSQMLASDIIGRKVVSSLGEDVGEVQDILLDATGQIAGVVLSMGGTLGIGGRDVALRWNQLEPHPDKRGTFVVHMAEEQLKAAPAFTPLGKGGAGQESAR